MLKANKFLAIIALFFFVVIIGSCGGGGGGSNPPSDTTVSGTVSPPAGVSPSSLTIVSLGETSPVSTTGSFSAEVYKEGVTVIAAMPEGKEFGLMNVVATSTTSTSSAKVTKGETKIVSAYKAASSSSIELNAKTTAVSMVFISPYFLTNDPAKAENLLSIIENNPEVTNLANVIESVFKESDPLSNLALQEALKDAVKSVINSIPARTISNATKDTVSSSPKILQLPKNSFKDILKAMFITTPPYYADQDYITLKATETSSGYDLSIESKNGGSVDWIAEGMQLDTSQFSSLNDLKAKASNNRSLYVNERSHILSGTLQAPAKSFLRYLDIISFSFDTAFDWLFGSTLEDRLMVPSTQDGIYLLRSYSGGWGLTEDSGEKTFVREQVPNGSTMDIKSLSVNEFMVVFDTMSAFVAFDKLFPDDMNKIAEEGLKEAFNKLPSVMSNPNPTSQDLLSVIVDVLKAMLSKVTESFAENVTKNFFITIWRIGEVSVSSLIDISGKASDLGKAVDRVGQLITYATPMETAIIVVGEPFPTPVDTEKPSTPTNLKATATSTTQIDLSWDPSTDNVGVAGYKIYRNGSHLKSVTTTSTSDIGLDPSTQYCYTVSAYDAASNESEQSNQACVTTLSTPDTTPPSIPTGLTATAVSSSQIDLAWNASTDNVGVAGYKIYDYYGTYLISVTSTSTSITGLNPNTYYCFTVSAYDAAGNESEKSSQACATTLSTPDLNDGLIAYYGFEGNANDSSGNGNHGTEYGGINYLDGKIGKAAMFDGENTYISVADNSSLRLNIFTITAWVRPDIIWGGNRIAEKGDSNSYWLDINPDAKALVGFYDGGYNDLISEENILSNNWYFIAGTYDGDSLKIYINGTLDNSLTLFSTPYQSDQPLIIGWKYNGITEDHFSGLIDELRIYNRALSESKIQELYLLSDDDWDIF